VPGDFDLAISFSFATGGEISATKLIMNVGLAGSSCAAFSRLAMALSTSPFCSSALPVHSARLQLGPGQLTSAHQGDAAFGLLTASDT